MNLLKLFSVLATCILLLAAKVDTPRVSPQSFVLKSSAVNEAGAFAIEFTCDGASASPPVEWYHAPDGTRCFALVMHHTPGPGDTHVYMVVYNIPLAMNKLEKNSKDVGVWGVNTVNGKKEYAPPCSKGPGKKEYTLTLFALSAEITDKAPTKGMTMDALLKAIKETTLGKTELKFTYDRTGKTSDSNKPPRDGPPKNDAPPPPPAPK